MTAALLLCWPIMVLAHELGHALAALRFTSGRVLVEVGSRNRSLVQAGRRLTISYSPLGAGGVCKPERPPATRRAAFWIVLGGPIADLVVLVLLLPAAVISSHGAHAVLESLAVLAGLNFVGDLIPVRMTLPTHGAQFSDALRAWHMLRNRPFPQAPSADRSRGSSPSEGVALVIGAGLGAIMIKTHALDHIDPLPWAIATALYFVQAIAMVRRSQPSAGR